jgi:hypothetical protein
MLLAMVPAVAVKLADVAPDATFAEVGTDSAGLLLESVTVAPPEPAACDNVTVQMDVPPELRLEGEHDTMLSPVGAAREIEAVREAPS